jgi:hypothetical protein
LGKEQTVNAKEKIIQQMDEHGAKMAKTLEEIRRKGGMSESVREQMIQGWEKKERLKKELKKAQQDETGQKNPILPRR